MEDNIKHQCVYVPTIERQHYNVISSFIGWTHTQNDSCNIVADDDGWNEEPGKWGGGGGHLDINIISYNIANPIMKIRQSYDHLIFIMGISIPRRQSVLCLYWNKTQHISSHGIHLFCKEYSVTHLNSHIYLFSIGHFSWLYIKTLCWVVQRKGTNIYLLSEVSLVELPIGDSPLASWMISQHWFS